MGKETLQLYLKDVNASVVRPVRELKGIFQVTLEPGEEKLVEFKITRDMLCFYSTNGTLISEPGYFHVWIGNSSNAEYGDKFLLE